MLVEKRPISNSDSRVIPNHTTTKVMFGEEHVSKIKVHPNFNKFSEEVIRDVRFGVVFFSQVLQKLIFIPILKDRSPKQFSIWIPNHWRYALLSTQSLKTF